MEEKEALVMDLKAASKNLLEHKHKLDFEMSMIVDCVESITSIRNVLGELGIKTTWKRPFGEVKFSEMEG